MDDVRLRCPICKKEVDLNEEVNIDIFNTITHELCKSKFSIKDSGTFKEIINKYPIFDLDPIAD